MSKVDYQNKVLPIFFMLRTPKCTLYVTYYIAILNEI